ncbi:MAG: hypothetical protein GY861_19705 [bacterium]|nr:hypothetical protein [bacterium]
MKSIIVFGLVFLMMVVGVSATDYTIPSGVKISISMINQEPDPVEPGDYVTVRFKIDNRGSDNAERMVFELLPKYPFSLQPNENAERDVGTVWGRQKDELGVIVKYNLKVDEDSISGNSPVNVRYKLKDGGWIKLSTDFNISVESQDAIVIVDSVDVPELVTPGNSLWINLTVKNHAHTLVKNLKVKLDTAATPSFIPLGSTGEKIITQLDYNEKADTSFKLHCSPDAEAGIQGIPIILEYYDQLNNRYSKNDTIGLIIGSPPDLVVGIDESNIYANSAGTVTVKFINKGLNDIKLLYIVLEETDDFELISSADVYVGNIDSDDYETADFNIFLNENSDAMLPLKIEYRDANNQLHIEKHNLRLKSYDTGDAVKYGLKEKSNFVGIVVVIVIIIGGIIAYKVFRKRRK